ncbi:hypothetical protein RFI_09431 [Reticulomyxa filosa]|uniref:Uncharacterized protein n=1 Tax=Reticulomyxa filosa TaxID=46433 RepID=X6NN47_RETFI|nr:hypothetical protein RFI_09431 [Reticulomyxa filosa]|eukprot:ETO27700.1 hypothetical protein RFI_09431 [Reticulomyxa filosa]
MEYLVHNPFAYFVVDASFYLIKLIMFVVLWGRAPCTFVSYDDRIALRQEMFNGGIIIVFTLMVYLVYGMTLLLNVSRYVRLLTSLPLFAIGVSGFVLVNTWWLIDYSGVLHSMEKEDYRNDLHKANADNVQTHGNSENGVSSLVSHAVSLTEVINNNKGFEEFMNHLYQGMQNALLFFIFLFFVHARMCMSFCACAICPRS